jgi:hypothetical protein
MVIVTINVFGILFVGWKLALPRPRDVVGTHLKENPYSPLIPTLKHYFDIVSDILCKYGTAILTFYLTFFLAYTLTFYLTFYLASILTLSPASG